VVPTGPIAWKACGTGFQCGTLGVPFDYEHPERGSIGIALKRHRAGDPARRIGSLLYNPGGPGNSAVAALVGQVNRSTPGLVARFDIVGFDPRGVGQSSAVRCDLTQGLPDPIPDPVPPDDAARQAVIASNQEYADDCARFSKGVLPYVGTDNVARDMDQIRAALGDERLTFLGQSYGTFLGQVYAELFPTRVRAMALDGVIDPALTTEEFANAAAEGFDRQLNAFGAWCQATAGCPWKPGTDVGGAFLSLADQLRRHPLTGAGGRPVGPGELYIGALRALYTRSRWQPLGAALESVVQGNGGGILQLSDAYLGGSSGSEDATTAINCLDHPVPRDLALFPERAQRAAARARVFGPLFAWGGMSCAVWPAPATRNPYAIKAPGTPPILVIGTTLDPATPYAWAEAVARQLDKGVLLGRPGDNHVAYFYSACVRSHIDAYLVDLRLPPTGTMCPS
jgi:pimeloyl-ACP methyl ester carboxylesterase